MLQSNFFSQIFQQIFRKKALEVGFYFIAFFTISYLLFSEKVEDKKECKWEMRRRDSLYRNDTWRLINEIEKCKSFNQ